MKASSTADATFDLPARVGSAIADNQRTIDSARFLKLKNLQEKIEMLEKRGLLRRQQFGAARSADFQNMFLKQG